MLELLRAGEISQGKAAAVLGITRWDVLELMASHHIPSDPRTPEEFVREADWLRQHLIDASADAGD